MRGVSGVVAVGVAALLVCCSADTHQEQDVGNTGEHNSANRYNSNDHKTRNLDSIGGGHLVREVRDTRPLSNLMPYYMPRRYNAYGGKRDPWRAGSDLAKIHSLHKRNFDEIDRSDLNQFIGKRNFDEIDRSELNPFIGKRNFDEIDRSDLNPFIGKRNFDEIDRTSMPFPYGAVKRIYHGYGRNFLETPMEGWRQQSFDKKRLQPDYPLDEIDASYFPIGPNS